MLQSKDALECEISNLKSNAQILKDENEKLTSNRYVLETEISTLKRVRKHWKLFPFVS